jgi:hypothetical protein
VQGARDGGLGLTKQRVARVVRQRYGFRTNAGSLATLTAIRRVIAGELLGNEDSLSGAGEKRQGQNRLPRLILYEHHQGWIVPDALFSQFPDCVLSIRKCCRIIS